MADNENENPEVIDDDVEGHLRARGPAANDDDDDVEGHMKHMGPALSGALNPDESTPSTRHTF